MVIQISIMSVLLTLRTLTSFGIMRIIVLLAVSGSIYSTSKTPRTGNFDYLENFEQFSHFVKIHKRNILSHHYCNSFNVIIKLIGTSLIIETTNRANKETTSQIKDATATQTREKEYDYVEMITTKKARAPRLKGVFRCVNSQSA